jgi:methylmalonyl-CoA/ethylmalonyl-CoA epimerase
MGQQQGIVVPASWTFEDAAGAASARELGLGRPHHLGWVVRDIERALPGLAVGLGCGPFHVAEVDHHASRPLTRGADRGPYNLLVAFTWLGSTLIEVLQPIGAGSPYEPFLERGEGIHHFGYIVPDLELAAAHLRPLGLRMLADATGPDFDVQACYLEANSQSTDPVSGIVIELIEEHPGFKEFMNPVYATIGHPRWDPETSG